MTQEVPAHADPVSDEQLMLAYADGDGRAFEALYGRHRAPLYRYLRRHLGTERADDCFQAIWMRVIRARNEYRDDAPFRAWLFTIAHNLVMDEHRRSLREGSRIDALADIDDARESQGDGEEGPEQVMDRNRLRARLSGLIAQLPVAQRDVWLLKQETGLSTEQIARMTESTPEGVKSRLRYAKQKLRAGMQRYVR